MSIRKQWQIIKQTSTQGITEYSVSDGVVGERVFSYDFGTLVEAETHCDILKHQAEIKQ
tara:strand:+ start:942 stop:1118 length:177 start_codon:yes stop_codon:yes gene_type:complete